MKVNVDTCTGHGNLYENGIHTFFVIKVHKRVIYTCKLYGHFMQHNGIITVIDL